MRGLSVLHLPLGVFRGVIMPILLLPLLKMMFLSLDLCRPMQDLCANQAASNPYTTGAGASLCYTVHRWHRSKDFFPKKVESGAESFAKTYDYLRQEGHPEVSRPPL